MGSATPAPAKPTRPAPASTNYRGRFNAARLAEGKAPLPDKGGWDAHHRVPQEYRGHKEFKDFDFDAQPAIRPQIGALASGGFLTEARNVVLLGPPGTGKTHLATALGVAAARHGHRVLFATATDWVTRLTDAHRAGRLPAELTKLRRYGLIIVV